MDLVNRPGLDVSGTISDVNRLVSVAAANEIKESLISDGVTAGVLTIAKTGSTARIVTFPDASLTVAGIDVSQTFTAAQTIRAASGLTTLQAATQDGIQLQGRAGGTGSYVLTLTPTTLTASRTATFPDASIVVAGSASALTSGRVPYATTGGLLTDAAMLTVSGQSLLVGDSTGSAVFSLRSAAASLAYIRSYQNGVLRWENGSATTIDWLVRAYDSGGTLVDTPLAIANAAGGAISIVRPFQQTYSLNGANLSYFSNTNAGTAAYCGLQAGSDSGTLGLRAYGSGHATLANQAWLIASGASTDLIIATTGTERMRVTAAGAVTCAGTLTSTGLFTASNQIMNDRTGGEASVSIKADDAQQASVYFYNRTGAGLAIYRPASATSLSFYGSAAAAVVASLSNSTIAAGNFTINYTTASTTTATGALVVAGGMGVAGAIYSDTHSIVNTSSSTPLVVGTNAKALNNYIIINTAAGYLRAIAYQSGGVYRWLAGPSGAAESGSDSGSPYNISAYSDAGSLIDTPISITRASGGAIYTPRPVSITNSTASTTTGTGALVVSGGIGIAGNSTIGGIAAIGSNATNAASCLTVGVNNPQTGTTQTGVYVGLTPTTNATTRISCFYAAPTMAAGSYTSSVVSLFEGVSFTVPSGVTVSAYYGLYLPAITKTGTVTNNWGIYSNDTTAKNYIGGNLMLGSTTDGMTAGGSLAITQDLAHRGTKIGFMNTAPIAQKTGYGTPTNAANGGSFDATTITLVNLAKAYAQLVLDLKAYGIIGA